MLRSPFSNFAAVLLAAGVVAAQPARSIERDLAYGDAPAHRLDLATPAGKGFPTLIFVHGGSLTSGDKADSDYGKVCDAFPGAGVACTNVNYRLLSAGAWPSPAEDVAAAIAWIHRNIASRGGDPGKLFLLGHSSGAMLVALVAADTSYLAQQKLTSSVLRGVMPMGSIMWDDDLRQSASEQINPPILKTNQQFADDARARGNQADVKVFADRTHYSNIRKIHERGDDVFAAVLGFVQRLAK